MKTNLTIIFAALALAACTAEAPLSQVVVISEIERNPEASYIDGLGGTLKWNYTTGLELKAMLDASSIAFDYVDAWYDAIIDEDGNIGGKYKKSNYSSDHICPGRTLFKLYDLTGKEKYRLAMDKLYEQIQEMPRTPEGGFWHKKIYPNQMWLDGLYMVEPFYAEYTLRYVSEEQKAANYADICHQFTTVYRNTWDEKTGLLRHAWDSSHEMFWCDPETGQSKHAWGRALGWYCMALVDVIEILPGQEERSDLAAILQGIYEVLPRYADPASGMWYQVLDCPGREGNYLEATCNAMFVYAWLKGIRLGCLDGLDNAKAAYQSMLDTFVTTGKDGLVNLNQCCEVAGLGGKENRSGDYDYYIHERVRSNDPKGIGPLIWAALEYERL
ncbi:MAG: glycoside hydrolase family 88 protein [Bacteroidales bacterium]|nr:glycoside hydrolase family 88 protein [Bacteroidales bacterium]